MSELLPVGTEIVFTRTLEQGPTSDMPACIFAKKGEKGVIVGHDCWEGYWVTWERWPAKFGAERKDFEPQPPNAGSAGQNT